MVVVLSTLPFGTDVFIPGAILEIKLEKGLPGIATPANEIDIVSVPKINGLYWAV